MGRNICLTCLYTKTLTSGTCGFPLDVSDILLDRVNAFTTLLVLNSHLLVHLSTFSSYLAPPLFTDWTEGLAPPWDFISHSLDSPQHSVPWTTALFHLASGPRSHVVFVSWGILLRFLFKCVFSWALSQVLRSIFPLSTSSLCSPPKFMQLRPLLLSPKLLSITSPLV